MRRERNSRPTLRFRAPAWFEAGGELHQTASDRCEIATVPTALRVVEAAGND